MDEDTNPNSEAPETPADAPENAAVEDLTVEEKAEAYDKLSRLVAGSVIEFEDRAGANSVRIKAKTAGAYPTYVHGDTLAAAAEQL